MTEHHSPAAETHHSPSHAAAPASKGIPTWAWMAVVIVGIAALFVFFSPSAPVQPSVPAALPDSSTDSVAPLAPESSETLDNTALSKSKYLIQLYTIDRDAYNLFEQAAAYRNETLAETKKFFLNCCDLQSEEQIFEELPPIPSDFSTVAYNFATGQLYQLGSVSGSYYKQPELYFHTDQTAVSNRKLAFSGWSKPQLNYWGDYGMTATPGSQFGKVDKGTHKTFTAAVFLANGWNIQNWVGTHMVVNQSAKEYFDITVSEEQTGQPYFLLGPTFPYFSKDWATKIIIKGTVKSTTPPGEYIVRVNPVAPPAELSQKWSEDHVGIYVPYGGLVPDTGFVTLNITVTE